MVEKVGLFGQLRVDETLVHVDVEGHESCAICRFLVGCCHDFK